MECAQLGLIPDGVLGHAYLIPRGTQATMMIGYRGYIALAYRSPLVQHLSHDIVHERDVFKFQKGTRSEIIHVPSLEKDRGNVMAAYAVAMFRSGGNEWKIMPRDDIEAIRKRSQAGGKGPWVTDWNPMALKTVIRSLCKYLPLEVETLRAVVRDEYRELGVDQAENGETATAPVRKASTRSIESSLAVAVEPEPEAPEPTDGSEAQQEDLL
jgi:recombination protein RecT